MTTPINATDPLLMFKTSMGSFVMEVFPTQAPKTTANFLSYVDSRFYDNTLFHRVVPGFVNQGGGYDATTYQAKSTLPAINYEITGLSNIHYSVAMARTNDPNSATSQFFINAVDNLGLNYSSASNPGYSVFGYVIQGMSVVDAMNKVAVDATYNVPLTDVVLKSVSYTRVDIDGVAGKAYRIYKAAFDRDPMQGDTVGLGYWIAKMDQGMDLIEVAARFIDSKEFRDLYGTKPTNGEFLTKVYENVLGRAPDKGGYDWWMNEMSTNPSKTPQKVLADFSESSENQMATLTLIGDGIIYSPWHGA